jgi:peptidoglycan/xylan/chitin deacetylase (PgdA/CDA1 family)
VPVAIFGLSAGVVLAGNAIGTAAGQDTTLPVAAVASVAEPVRPELPHTVVAAGTADAQSAPVLRDVDCRSLKCVAITFDDGPGAETYRLLDMLAKEHAVATWFPVGEVLTGRPGMLRQIAKAGNEIGNHTWDHAQLTARSDASIDREVGRTARAIQDITGTRPRLVRPPYGSMSSRVAGELGRLGDPVILWDVDPLDWKYRDADHVYSSVMSQVRPGSIVLMHDIHPTTVAAVPRILRALAGRGYVFVTVSELFHGSLRPGALYHSRHHVPG